MISKEHKKHTNLARPYGDFGRNEWAIVGGPCTIIKALADNLIGKLSADYQCAYADALHSEALSLLPGRLANGAFLEYTDQSNSHQFVYNQGFNPFTFRAQFAAADMVLVNGNHNQAKAQVVIIDENKKMSLQKRVAQLTNLQLILLADNATDVFDFIKEAIPAWQQIPVLHLNDTESILNFFKAKLQSVKPVLHGLVLAGGKSQRMGQDKGAINWYGKEQRYHTADLLTKYCSDVFISCREDQRTLIDSEYQTLPDTFTGLGPYGAILSAFREKPNTAWLVLACDLPLMDEETLDQLVAGRNTMNVATAFKSPVSELPEPLITIWEPKSYPVLLSYLAQGYSCPRKTLINSDAYILEPIHPEALTNVNTPEELEKVKRAVHQRIATA